MGADGAADILYGKKMKGMNPAEKAAFRQEKIDEYNVAQLLYMLEVQTAIAGELYNINTFNQPGVEQAKNYTYALMGRAGYEESAHTLQEKMASV